MGAESYLVCWVECKEGYEPKDPSLNKIGCRMSDGKWLKPFKAGTHKCAKVHKHDIVPYCERPDVKPTYVENGAWKNCDINKGKHRCNLQCDPGYIPEGNGKWVCEDNKITHPIHSCIKVQAPPQLSDCRTPHLTHGVYACSWNKVCHGKDDDHHVHRRDDDEGEDRHGGNKHKKKNKNNKNNKDHDKDHHVDVDKLCRRECTLQCDINWKPLSGSDTAVCVRHTREWVEPVTVCVPDNFKHDKQSQKLKTEEFEDDSSEDADKTADFDTDVASTTAAPIEVPTEAPGTEAGAEGCAALQEKNPWEGWGFGQCPDLKDPNVSPC